MRLIATLATLFGIAALSAAELPDDQKPFKCMWCEGWNRPVDPRQLAANTWQVGTAGLSAILIVDPQGLVLIDGGLPQSVAPILANIRRLGHRPEDIRWILNSHAHFDHAGGIAALARITGARVAAGSKGVVALNTGLYHADDPQIGFGGDARYPAVAQVRAVDDDDTITVGTTTITAIATPGHAPGGMSWTWQACDDGGHSCKTVVYMDSLNAVSAEGYRFGDPDSAQADLRASIARIHDLPCDIAMAPHPDQLAVESADGKTVCAGYADAAVKRLEARLARERTPPSTDQ